MFIVIFFMREFVDKVKGVDVEDPFLGWCGG